jgi:hypothetical protein
MLYILIAVAAASFGTGYLTSHQIDQVSILRLERAIDRGNADAAATLGVIKDRVATAQNDALKSNLELDNANQSAINTINAYDKRLDAVQLFDAGYKPRCPDALPASRDTGVSKDAAHYASYATELDQLVKNKARECDTAANYALNAYKFVFEQNCGIAR